MSKGTKTLKSRLNKLMADGMSKYELGNPGDPSEKNLFKNLKAVKMDNRSRNFGKLYNSLVPFLKEANLYGNLQKIIAKNKSIMGPKTKFNLAAYFMGQEFGISSISAPHCLRFLLADGKGASKIRRR